MMNHEIDIIIKYTLQTNGDGNKIMEINDLNEYDFMCLLRELMSPTVIPDISIKHNTHPIDNWTVREWALYRTLLCALKRAPYHQRLQLNEIYEEYLTHSYVELEKGGF